MDPSKMTDEEIVVAVAKLSTQIEALRSMLRERMAVSNAARDASRASDTLAALEKQWAGLV